MATPTEPATVRHIDTPAAKALADLGAMLDDLQTVLFCCQRLLTELDPATGPPDELVVESVWTTTLLSYGRCFTDAGRGMALTEDDVTATSLRGDVLNWHQLLRRLGKHWASPAHNPRERLSVAAAVADDGTATGIAITSLRQPAPDDRTVRQTGALAYELSQVVERRMSEQQERVLTAAKAMSADRLGRLPLIDIA
ncbi:MAG TPA: hypothetical protein VH333_16000 [Pseudonocardiaceae bacterium]|jgi:hypothetical protein|nr:hypothetical protein [Pseudonocardiaceae bacterium]